MQLDFTRAPISPGTDLARRLAPVARKATPRRRKKEVPPHWERGYRSHYYRNERGDKLGEVRLSDRGDLPVVYHWAAGNYSGAEGSLVHARARVEETVGFGMRQLSLF
ncbi:MULTISPECIES: hypothetical protein [unclassified Cupriavidus]|jgi:hypothetical protein|uniref:hypothetical protein n=1 Tax=unclassified Cupriavidus TaxID=2640874 RepID=UPI001C001484|nr:MULTISPECIES: hypothetical protein [unclassified Cupriavidus]MCA3187402.1 hypothetical protein [Cupriavidus sp.]MCA3191682.1 hypothetical protein [Cupriavidus sp.]MCA3197912.1 hypothetical protein [Cupriavidus sp.]MCA3200596.1 hypothetical protein [Cupriavidus sp.]MCA3208246.1 hypothetical protein [Cupriavidus sp.]